MFGDFVVHDYVLGRMKFSVINSDGNLFIPQDPHCDMYYAYAYKEKALYPFVIIIGVKNIHFWMLSSISMARWEESSSIDEMLSLLEEESLIMGVEMWQHIPTIDCMLMWR